jgi:hypothetical protein
MSLMGAKQCSPEVQLLAWLCSVAANTCPTCHTLCLVFLLSFLQAVFLCVPQSTHEDKDYVHIVMELCNGGELFDHIVEAQHFTERKVRSILPDCQQWTPTNCHSSKAGVMQASEPATEAAQVSSIGDAMQSAKC